MKHKLIYTTPVIKKLDSIIKGTQAKTKGVNNDGGSNNKNKCKVKGNGQIVCS